MIVKRICAVIMAALLFAAGSADTVYAFNQDVKEGTVAIVLFLKGAELCCTDKDGVILQTAGLGDIEYSGGSGFFVGKSGEDPQYIVTNEHVIDDYINAGEGEEFMTLAGVEADENGNALYMFVTADSCELRIYYSQNTYDLAYVDCYGDSEKVDLAVLRLKDPTDKRRSLPLMEPTEDMVGETVYTVGYPGNADNSYSSASKYGIEDASVHKGTIVRFVVNAGKGVERISIDAVIQHGNSGGPLVTEDGSVIGVNTNVESNSPYNEQIEVDYYAISASELLRFLDKNNIPHEVVSEGGFPILYVIIGAAVLVIIAGIAAAVILSRKKKVVVEPPVVVKPPAAAGSQDIYQPEKSENPDDSGFRIQCVSGALKGQRYMIRRRSPIRIGRDSAVCNVVYPPSAPGISKSHCTVWVENGIVKLRDDGSTHGTFIAPGRKLAASQTVDLRPGDSFYLGSPQESFVVAVKGGN